MKLKREFVLGCLSTLCLCGSISRLGAQETQEIEQLRQQLKQATETFEKSIRDHQKVIQGLEERLQRMENPPATTNAPLVAAPPGPVLGEGPDAAVTTWRPSDPIRIRRGSAYMDVGLVSTFAAGSSTSEDIEGELEPGGHDPNQRGFTVQGVEAVFTGAVDPYFRGLATLTFQIDSEGETSTELEEAYLESVSLPGNLQLRGGEYFTEFGRQNPTHLHTWGFVDTPLVSARMFGPDGLRNPGARVSWLLPTPFYSEFFFGVQDSHGETATSFRSEGGHHGGEEEGIPLAYRHADNDRGVRSLGDMLWAPRYAVSVDVTDEQTLLFGTSAAFGPNASGGEDAGGTDTRIYGLDATWKWKSARHSGGFPFVSFQAEGMARRYDAGAFDWDLNGDGLPDADEVMDPATGLPAQLRGETLEDYGLYTQLLYGFRRGWVAGMRLDYVTGNRGAYERSGLTFEGEPLGRDPERASRWRLSPNLTWYPSEFSKLRLQYNYDNRKGFGEDHSVWLQFEFILGAHAAHTF